MLVTGYYTEVTQRAPVGDWSPTDPLLCTFVSLTYCFVRNSPVPPPVPY